MAKQSGRQGAWTAAKSLAVFAVIIGYLAGQFPAGSSTLAAQQVNPTPTADPFAIPKLPDNPTQVDYGRLSYFYNCMPCHGDHGQGLTNEFRETWEEDHQNCWARGCHSGRPGEAGFPIPTVVPALVNAPGALERFPSANALHQYLQETHPPQNPGVLPEEEYWSLTAYLWDENGQLPPGIELGLEPAPVPPSAAVTAQVPSPTDATSRSDVGFSTGWPLILGLAAGLILIALFALLQRRRR